MLKTHFHDLIIMQGLAEADTRDNVEVEVEDADGNVEVEVEYTDVTVEVNVGGGGDRGRHGWH